MNNGKVTAIINPEKRTGVAPKTGKPWTIKEISVELDSGSIIKADTFNEVNVGDTGEVERKTFTKRDGSEGYSYNFTLPRQVGAVRAYNATPDNDTLNVLVNMLKTIDGKLDKLLDSRPEAPTQVRALNGEEAQAQAEATRDAERFQKSVVDSFSDGTPLPEYEGEY